MMKMILLLGLVSCAALRSPAQGPLPSSGLAGSAYEALAGKATLIVLATPTDVQPTGEQAQLDPKHVRVMTADGREIPITVVGVETTFQVLAVLKGQPDVKQFILHHYGRENALDRLQMNGDPRFVYFEPKAKKCYLMFLRQESDGRYAAAAGQYDPQDSISELATTFPGAVTR